MAAQAQFSRLADEIEWKRLDIHPRPTLVPDPGLGLYGRFGLDLVRKQFGGASYGCHRSQPDDTRWAADSVSRSHVGWRQDRALGRGGQSGPTQSDCR